MNMRDSSIGSQVDYYEKGTFTTSLHNIYIYIYTYVLFIFPSPHGCSGAHVLSNQPVHVLSQHMKALRVWYRFNAETTKRSVGCLCIRFGTSYAYVHVRNMYFVRHQSGIGMACGLDIRCPLVRSVRACVRQLSRVLRDASGIKYGHTASNKMRYVYTYRQCAGLSSCGFQIIFS